MVPSPVQILIEIAGKVHRWRWLTRERRADLILLLDDARAEIVRLEDRIAELDNNKIDG